jgi:hypothetical protein
MATKVFCKYRVVEGLVELELRGMISLAMTKKPFSLTIILGFTFVGFVEEKRSMLVFYRRTDLKD